MATNTNSITDVNTQSNLNKQYKHNEQGLVVRQGQNQLAGDLDIFNQQKKILQIYYWIEYIWIRYI